MLYWIPAFWFNVWGCVGGVECLVDDAKVWTLYCTLWDRGLLVKRTKHPSLSSELKDWSERIRRLNALIKGMIFVFQRYRKSNHNHNDNRVTYLISWFNYFCFQKNNVSLWALFFTWENLLAMVDIGVTSLILYLFNLSFGSKCSLDPLTRFPLGPRTSGSKLYKNRGLVRRSRTPWSLIGRSWVLLTILYQLSRYQNRPAGFYIILGSVTFVRLKLWWYLSSSPAIDSCIAVRTASSLLYSIAVSITLTPHLIPCFRALMRASLAVRDVPRANEPNML